jgi:hypothetical protein
LSWPRSLSASEVKPAALIASSPASAAASSATVIVAL